MPSFTFFSDIPQAGDNPSDSQPEILQNFTSLADPAGSWVTQDHYGFGTGFDGQHNQATFPKATSPVPTPGGTVGALFATVIAGLNQLNFKNSSASYQLTNLPIITGANPGTAGGSVNYIDTPWNMRMYFGQTNSFNGSNRTVVFPTPLSNYFFVTSVANTAAGNITTTALIVGGVGGGLALGTSANASVNWSAFGRI
jgi:hypothetical protein